MAGYAFRPDSAFSILNTDEMDAMAKAGELYAKQNKEFAKQQEQIKTHGYAMEPWEEEVDFRNKALKKGAGTADFPELEESQRQVNEGGGGDIFEGMEDVDHEGNPFPEQEVDEAGLPVAGVAPEDFGPNGPLVQDAVQPEAQQQAAQPMFQMPGVQNAQQWMGLKNSLTNNQQQADPVAPQLDPQAPQVPQPLSQFEQNRADHKARQNQQFDQQRNKQFQSVHGMSKEDADAQSAVKDRERREFISNRNQKWKQIGV